MLAERKRDSYSKSAVKNKLFDSKDNNNENTSDEEDNNTLISKSNSSNSVEQQSSPLLTTNNNNQISEKLSIYKHIKPMSIDSFGKVKLSYPSLNEILNSNDDNWLNSFLPSAPPIEESSPTTINKNNITTDQNIPSEYVNYPNVSYPISINLPNYTTREENLSLAIQNTVLPAIVIHKIQEDDSLTSIALKYGVSEESIKLQNRMMESDLSLYGKTELEIPEPTQLPKEEVIKKELTPEELKALEDKKKAIGLTFFMRLCNVCEDEARYYLSLHDFDFREAFKEYKSDIEWQREDEEKRRINTKRKEMKKFAQKYPLIVNIVSTLSFCFPFLENTKKQLADPYGNVELDLLRETNDDNVINYASDDEEFYESE
ncbi:hypothetical protein ABK040_007211 [Willaertia magna]